MSYDNINVHWTMLKDELRTNAFRDAIQQIVRPSDSIIDFGCGTGILSFFCAAAGAETIYAIDQAKIIRVAKKIAAQNGYDNIQFFYGDADNFDLSTKVNVIVSEWMGHFVFAESMFEHLIKIRDQYLKDSGRMIPASISLTAGLVCDKALYQELSYFKNKPYGIDFSFLGDWLFSNVLYRKLSSKQILEHTIPLATLDMLTVTDIPKLRGSIVLKTAACIYAICGWFDAKLTDSVFIRTGPFDPETHWRQLVFPLPEPLVLKAGDKLEVSINPHQSSNSDHKETLWLWSVSSGDKHYQMSGFMRNAWVKRSLSTGWLDSSD